MKSLMLFVVCFILSCSISAQNNNEINRKGFMFGVSSGIANSRLSFRTTNQNDINLALNWKMGYVLNPKLTVLINGAVSVYQYDLSDRERLRDFGGVFASAQYFVSNKFWTLGGVGVGTDAPVFYDINPEKTNETNYYSGIGIISGAGYEVYRKKNFAIDVQARLNYGSVKLSIGRTNGFTTALLIGINFY